MARKPDKFVFFLMHAARRIRETSDDVVPSFVAEAEHTADALRKSLQEVLIDTFISETVTHAAEPTNSELPDWSSPGFIFVSVEL